MLLILLAAVVLLGGAGGGAWYFMQKKAADAGHEEAAAPEPKHAPTYMPLENMVVNLADVGGERFAQIGITLELDNDKAADQIKAILPKVRSNVLLMVSQRSSDELLKRDGKEKLAADIVAEISRALGYEVEAPRKAKADKADKAGEEEADDEEKPRKKKKKAKAESAESPVHGVLFSAFIVQ
ncbi:MAG: flagellar basal body-associated FliL family protein [Gammaproteobacteria bacterium]|nr:flagellar basal body-associated FliL family protein [Gammaproteobacteria bacterium]